MACRPLYEPMTVSSLTHICITRSSHYLNQCCDIVHWALRSKLQWNFNRNSYIFIQENAFKTVVRKMAAILYRPQCVKWEFKTSHHNQMTRADVKWNISRLVRKEPLSNKENNGLPTPDPIKKSFLAAVTWYVSRSIWFIWYYVEREWHMQLSSWPGTYKGPHISFCHDVSRWILGIPRHNAYTANIKLLYVSLLSSY